ncbi:MAG: glycogen/starch/alpha-glucan phosphorylase, partial [Agathobacter sp.]|nr:glycogen/starch/alpha-glucan phosphorylase [Agathobacter sp.]
SINNKIKVVFIENYRVSNAELIFAAADVSEQISTASKEASGTGNMKFMLNGAIQLATLDGATIEIVEEVGEENAVIFGLLAKEVIEYQNNHSYHPIDIYNSNFDIRRVVDQLVNGYYANGDYNLYRELYDELINWDTYFVLKDFESYADAHRRLEALYRDKTVWAKMSLINIASCGKFSSDRTIQEYVDDIWHLDRIDLSNH